jgi:hypothetical protein
VANSRTISKIGFTVTALAVAAFLLVRREHLIRAGSDESRQPVWEIDLSKFGYQGRPPVALDRAEHWGFWTYQQGVVFTQPNIIAAFFVIRDSSADDTSAPTKAAPSDRYRLVTVFLTADRGELIKKLSWPLPRSYQSVPPVFFFPATKGRFVVGIANTLTLYSPDYEVIAHYQVHTELNPIASPAGDTILLQDARPIEGKWVSQMDLLDADQLSVRESWKGLPQMYQKLWSEDLAWISQRSLYFKAGATPPKQLIESKREFCGYWGFVNKDALAVVECGGGEKLVLVSTEGKIVQEFDLGLEQLDGAPVSSRDGRRFAVPSYEWGSGRNLNPQKLTARVFDLGEERPLLTLDVPPHYGTGDNFHTPHGDTRFGWGGLALSPDGERFVVKSGPIVGLYQVPKKGPASACGANCNNEKGTAPNQAAVVSPAPQSSAPPRLVQGALSWLPADTETVVAAVGPFLLPGLGLGAGETQAGPGSGDEVRATFRGLPFELFGFKDGILGKHFRGEQVLLGVEGSRHFRAPSGLGEGPFEGCAIAVFAVDVTDRANSFLKDSASIALRAEQIEGQRVIVFQEKREQNVWTTFVAFPRASIAVAASDEGYLREVLARLNGRSGERALPDSLPEWKHVNVHAAVWAVRHYDRKEAAKDPTSPFGGRRTANRPDDEAVGVTFSFDPGESKTATITYLSGDKNILQNAQKGLFPVESELGAREMHIRYRQIEPGVVEGSYDLEHIESAELFVFVLESLLGHAIYL